MEKVKKEVVTNGTKKVRPKTKAVKKEVVTVPVKKESNSTPIKKQRKKYVTNGTVKQKKALELLKKATEKGGKPRSLKGILLEAGYSEESAKNPKRVFQRWVVNEKLKILGVKGEGREEKHKFLLNNRIRQTISYPIEIDTNEVIKRYKEEFPGSRCYNVMQEGAFNIFEFSVPNSQDISRALEFSYKHFPVIPEKPQVNAAGSSKRKEILRALAEKKGFHLKKPIKLGVSETSSQSTN